MSEKAIFPWKGEEEACLADRKRTSFVFDPLRSRRLLRTCIFNLLVDISEDIIVDCDYE